MTPFLVIPLGLLFAPCLINLVSISLQQQIQKETPNSNQTINQFLLQYYQPLPTKNLLYWEEPDVFQVDSDGESLLHPKIDNAPGQQEAL